MILKFIALLAGISIVSACSINENKDGNDTSNTTSIEHVVLPAESTKMTTLPVAPITTPCYSQSKLYNIPIMFNNVVPGDLDAFNNQSQVDCFAWQSFIALNWPEDTTKRFGDPADLSFVQWETYIPINVLFPAKGVAPPAWGSLVSDKYAKMFNTQNIILDKNNTKLLTLPSKITSSDTLIEFGTGQAAPANGPSWLGAQNSTNVWYEIKLNKDYYDYVVENGYYNAKTQHADAKKNIPMVFPKGNTSGTVGAIELKAAWMEVTDTSLEKWSRYKLSKAAVLDPLTDELRTITVALVGLHILHKTENQPTWVWATFEQVDNVPGSSTPPHGYNFKNDQCVTQTVDLSGGGTTTVTCVDNTSPPYELTSAKPVPIQLSRHNAIDIVDAGPINTKMQKTIKKYYPDSVWQYYELVDVIWSQSLQADPTKPIQIPRKINASSMQSGAHIVANTTLESYVQDTLTCYQCHVFSHIADYPPDSKNNTVFGDFSFAIKSAKYDPDDVSPH
ncbi:MAG: hypothetical protein ACN4GM_06170 [Gammaproteobacteria bacterium]